MTKPTKTKPTTCNETILFFSIQLEVQNNDNNNNEKQIKNNETETNEDKTNRNAENDDKDNNAWSTESENHSE